jgi:hypothetical protein
MKVAYMGVRVQPANFCHFYQYRIHKIPEFHIYFEVVDLYAQPSTGVPQFFGQCFMKTQQLLDRIDQET